MKRLLFVAVLAFLGWHCTKQSDPEEPKKKEEKPSVATAYKLSDDKETLLKWLDTATTTLDLSTHPTLKRITIIGKEAFKETPIVSITLPNTVEKIEEEAFEGCTSLTTITLPKNANFRTIALGTFEGCKRLTHIDIPDSVKEIEKFAFADAGLTEVKLPKELFEIKEQAFARNPQLKHITLPKTISHISTGAFMQTGLQTVTLNGTEPPRLSFPKGEAALQRKGAPFPFETLVDIIVPREATNAYRVEKADWAPYRRYINRKIAFTPLRLEKTEVIVKVDEIQAFSIYGSKRYQIRQTKDSEAIAIVGTPDQDANNVTRIAVKGLKEGTFTCTITDVISDQDAQLKVTVVKK